jgi:hypothetical protein
MINNLKIITYSIRTFRYPPLHINYQQTFIKGEKGLFPVPIFKLQHRGPIKLDLDVFLKNNFICYLHLTIEAKVGYLAR